MIQLGTIENKRTTEKFAMATKADKKGGGAKTSRSETVTVRLDPKMRYLAEIAARVQRRTLSSYIEWAIEESLKSVTLDFNGTSTPISEVTQELWDVDEADRFFYLARVLPALLTHDEQTLWKLLEENERLWVEVDGARTFNGEALRQWLPGAKFAVSTGADIGVIRLALAGDGAAAEKIGLVEWAKSRK